MQAEPHRAIIPTMRFIWAGLDAQSAPVGLVNLILTLRLTMCWAITQLMGALNHTCDGTGGQQQRRAMVSVQPNAPIGRLAGLPACLPACPRLSGRLLPFGHQGCHTNNDHQASITLT